jgi:two-component system, OmpR family, copper resistance phosphate regulon response regulator CusR
LAGVLRQGFQEEGYAVGPSQGEALVAVVAQADGDDLLVLDAMLPELDGTSICRRLRAQRNAVLILLLTARDTLHDRVLSLDSRADDYLTKPFSFHELLARARALLRRDTFARSPVVRVGDLKVNTTTHEVWRAGKPIELATREYAILEYFLRTPNRVLRRSEIAEHVWNYDFVSMSNVVDVYVGHLRRKLGDERESRLLRTVRGTGCQLGVPKTWELLLAG